jgi:hypothetical protein
MEMFSQLHTPVILPILKEPKMRTKQEIELVPAPIWKRLYRKLFLALLGIDLLSSLY